MMNRKEQSKIGQMKRPMESSELLEETEKRRKRREMGRERQKKRRRKKSRDRTSVVCLALKKLFSSSKTNEGKWPQFELALRQIGALLVLDKEQLKTSWNFCDKTITAINSEAQTFLEQWKLLEATKVANLSDVIDTNGDKKLKMLFFFVRLIRKLAGELETPYESYRQKDTEKANAILGAIRLSAGCAAPGKICHAPNAGGAFRQQFGGLKNCWSLTFCAPIIIDGQQQQQKVDFDKMVEKCIYYPENYGVASVFADLVRKAIVQNGNKK
ncbi:hypothetical protein niasHT_026822 [Heterodera trifolii]|uniref:Uncharacterized protein n=1 Tax=Heterodera trifolii TaxID=157864 RepID=A0ABD2KLH5_9BILA